jgi:LPS export ABC transporter permease LptG/LPS export ABC transporter permease LptF
LGLFYGINITVINFFDRYIYKELTPPFLLGLLITTFVFLMNEILLLSDVFITKGVSFSTAAKVLFYLIPAIIAFTLPMAILMGILAGLSRLSSNSEIMAFKTLGISYKRLLRPVFVFSFGGWLLTSFLTLYLAPHTNYKWVQMFTHSVLAKVKLEINPREFNEDIPHAVLFIQDISLKKDWENVFAYFSDPEEEPRVILAKKGRLNFYPEEKRAILVLYDGVVHTHSRSQSEKYGVTSFKQLEEEINVNSFFSSLSYKKRVREKDIKELIDDQKVIKAELASMNEDVEGPYARWQKRKNYISHWVEIHKKFAFPFACFVFALLGLPLGASTRKGGRTSGFTISLGIILIYYVLITAGEKFAMDGKISPFLGIWGANVLLLLVGIYLFSKSLKESRPFSAFLRLFKGKDKSIALTKRKKSSRRRLRLSLRFPNILDRYIIRKYLVIFSLVFLALLWIYIIVTFFERIDNIYEHEKSVVLLLDYIRYSLPEFIHYVLPVAVLTATLLCLGLLTKFNEITAMKACGISVYRIVLPVLFMASIASFLSFYLQENVLPYANKKAEEIWNKINDVPPRSYSYLDRRWVLGKEKNRIYYYNYFDPEESAFSKLSIYDIDLSSWSVAGRYYAEKGYLNGNNISLRDCWHREFEVGKPVEFERKKEMNITIGENKDYFLKKMKEPDQMSYGELKDYIEEIEERGFETQKFKVALNYKISFPIVSLIMTLLGIPFAFSMGKRGTLVGIGLSLVIAMIYWGAIAIFRGLGEANYLNVYLAAWGPNLIFGLIGLYLVFTLRT